MPDCIRVNALVGVSLWRSKRRVYVRNVQGREL